MPKTIIFCADGTWNHPNEPKAAGGDGQRKLNTNVAKLADQRDSQGNIDQPGAFASTADQVVIYDDGVGVEFPEFLGGAFGVGIFGKVKQGYAQILEKYEKGDRLFLFGFSRGAYTARSLAGMLSLIGLPTVLPAGDRQAQAREAAEKAFLAYATPVDRQGLLKAMAAFALEIPTIAMQGMWDTVGSLGFTGALFGAKDPVVYGFLDTNLHDNTQAAFHAMSIDEHRGEFVMTPWPGKTRNDQVLRQVWFSGVHSDVGGSATELGTKDTPTALADITLSWMLKNAEACGAKLSPAADMYRAIDPMKAIVPSKDSFSPLWVINRHRSIPAGSTVANSVAVRLQWDATYRPPNLSLTAGGALVPGYGTEAVVAAAPAPDGIVVPSNSPEFDTGFDVAAGQNYRFTAAGEWVDQQYPSGPDGDPNPGFVRDVLTLVKRKRDARWMALLGRIGHDDWFLIGSNSTRSFPAAGRLFCCANDGPPNYGNNQGSVVLKIEKV
jgi:uncharacterized protein (DUF2235 family)